MHMQFEILKSKSYKIQANTSVTVLDYKETFWQDVLDNDDLSYYSFKVNEHSESISFDRLYRLDIKINETGKFIFFFLKETFQKDQLISNISSLKEMPVSTIEEKQKKITALLEISKEENPVFAIFSPLDNAELVESNLSEQKFPIFFIKPKEKKVKIDKRTGLPKEPSKLSKVFMLIWKEKLFSLFALLATMIFSFSFMLGLYNCYPNNAVYIFFFICVAAAVILNGVVFKDLYKKLGIKNPVFISSIIFNVLGIGAGMGCFVAYFNALTNIPEVMPSLSTLCAIGVPTCIGFAILSITISILILKLVNKKEPK